MDDGALLGPRPSAVSGGGDIDYGLASRYARRLIDNPETDEDERTAAHRVIDRHESQGESNSPDDTDSLGVVVLSDIDVKEVTLPLLGRLAPEQGDLTIVYGTGGAGKGTLVSQWLAQAAREDIHTLVIDYEGHTQEWRRRTDALAAPDGFIHYLDPIRNVAGDRLALIDLADRIRAYCEANAIGFVVVDSVLYAITAQRGEHDAAGPQEFQKACVAIDRPVLGIAHTTKAQDARYPFGSVYWHNAARRTMSLARQEQDLKLTVRKANNGKSGESWRVDMTFVDPVGLTSVAEVPWSLSLISYCIDVLEDEGRMNTNAIVEDVFARFDLDRKPERDSVFKALRNHSAVRSERKGRDTEWWLVDPTDTEDAD